MDGLRNFNDYEINGSTSVVDIQSFALSVDIIASKLIKKMCPSLKAESKFDYFIRTGIKEKELGLITDKNKLDEFYSNCLIFVK